MHRPYTVDVLSHITLRFLEDHCSIFDPKIDYHDWSVSSVYSVIPIKCSTLDHKCLLPHFLQFFIHWSP